MAETSTSVVASEVENFDRLADDWWDPRGASAMLHKLNPVRLGYIRDWIDQHWSLDVQHQLFSRVQFWRSNAQMLPILGVQRQNHALFWR